MTEEDIVEIEGVAEDALRKLAPSELPALAQLWHDGWMETHGPNVPEALLNLRTLEDFERRLETFFDDIRVTGPLGGPTGFCAIREDELYQLFVAPEARGTGIASTLIRDGEARLAAGGVTEAWLDTVPENARARAFYEREGWQERGLESVAVDTSEGSFKMPLVVYTKQLGPPADD
ncbi:MAG: GNAT family N-acetyltransferase [Rhodobacteraceae bacterium]|nr:GNAT family N-acetyltransferase [Paracoccaceae bacterium]